MQSFHHSQMARQTLIINADIFHVDRKISKHLYTSHTPKFLLTQLLKGLDICGVCEVLPSQSAYLVHHWSPLWERGEGGPSQRGAPTAGWLTISDGHPSSDIWGKWVILHYRKPPGLISTTLLFLQSMWQVPIISVSISLSLSFLKRKAASSHAAQLQHMP